MLHNNKPIHKQTFIPDPKKDKVWVEYPSTTTPLRNGMKKEKMECIWCGSLRMVK